MSVGGWIALGEAIINTGAAVASGFIESDKAKNDLNIQKEIANRKLGELDANFAQSKLELESQYSQSRQNLNYNIGYTNTQRAFGLNLASQTNVKNNQFMYEDLSMMMDQMAAAEGQAMQRASLTGFRNTGSQELGLKELERENQYQIDRAMETIKLSSAQSYAMASENYYSATAQIEQYRTNLANLQVNFNNSLKGLELQRDQMKNELNDAIAQIDRDIADAEYEWWEVGLDILTFGLAGAGKVSNAFDQDDINAMQTQFYAEQLESYEKVNGNKKNPSVSLASKSTYMAK